MNEREVLDIRQAAQFLQLSPDALYKYASEGKIPAFKFGNRWRFKRASLIRWMDELTDVQAEKSARVAL